MNHLTGLLLVALAPLAFVSCASQGNVAATSSENLSAFAPGSTTKRQVHAQLGQPHDVRPQPDGTRWTYYYVTTKMNGLGLIPVAGLFLPDSNTSAQISHVHFDRAGRFTRSSVTSKSEMKNSFASLGRAGDSFKNDTQHVRVRAEMDALGLPFDEKEATKAKDAGTILGANPES